MKYRTLISADEATLSKLISTFDSDELKIIKEGEEYYLLSDKFSEHDNPIQIYEKALCLALSLNGVLSIFIKIEKPIRILNVLEYDEDGKRKMYGFGSGDITLPSFITGDEIDKVNVYKWIKDAEADGNIAKVLRLLNKPMDWTNLYRILEVIKKDIEERKRRIEDLPGYDKAEVERFTMSANHHLISGDESRHGHTKGTPRRDPITLRDAQELIKGLVTNWLNEKNA